MKNPEMTLGASLIIIFLCLLFGGNGVAIKYSLTGLGPFTSAGIRFSMAAFVIILWARYKNIPLRLGPGQRWPILIQCCLFTAQLSCFHIGLGRTSASHGALVSNVLPFVVLILAHFFIPGDKITLRKCMGVALGFIGVLVLFFDEPDLNENLHSGDMIVLGAVLFWSVSAVYIKRIISRFHVVQITLYPMLFGIPFFFLGGMLWDDPMFSIINLTIIKALLFQSVGTAAFGFLAWNTMLKRFGTTALHSFIFIIPLSGVLSGVMMLNEPVTSHLLISIIFVVTGIVVVNLRLGKKVVVFSGP